MNTIYFTWLYLAAVLLGTACDFSQARQSNPETIETSTRIPSAYVDYADALPGLDRDPIGALSDVHVEVKKPIGAIAKIDVLLLPLSPDRKSYKDLASFVQGIEDAPALHVESIFRRMRFVIDSLPLGYGFRITAEESPPEGVFYFRLLGGEPLGNTVQLTKAPSVEDGSNLLHTGKYSGVASFKEYFLPNGCDGNGKSQCRKRALGTQCAITFNDQSPAADVHMLAIPGEKALNKGYVSSFQFFKSASADEIRALFLAIKENIIDFKRLANQGAGSFRLITNAGTHANQTVPHMHVHVVRGGVADKALAVEPAVTKIRHRSFTSRHIREVLGHIKKHTLVVFDIDETLLLEDGHHMHGSFGVEPAEGLHTKEAWDFLQDSFVQKGHANVIAITARCANTPAAQALQKMGFITEASWLDNANLSNFSVDGRKREGFIFYACFTSKGRALIDILKSTGMPEFQRVLFIDDNEEYVKQVTQSMSHVTTIESLSIIYRGLLHPKKLTPLHV